MFFIILNYAVVINIGIALTMREAEGRRVPVDRLVNRSGLAATTAIAVMPLGLQVLGGCLHQSKHPKYLSQLRHYTPPLLRNEMIFSIILHHSLRRGIPLIVGTILLSFFLMLLLIYLRANHYRPPCPPNNDYTNLHFCCLHKKYSTKTKVRKENNINKINRIAW